MAQLGARFHGMEEVKGSNPFRSTKSPPLVNSTHLWKIWKESFQQRTGIPDLGPLLFGGKAIRVPT